MYYGELSGIGGEAIDLCLCRVSLGPNSYTGEDTVELHCHGSPVVLSEVLRALFAQGVRHAEAGEFTKRAFLNGRMDLTRAEAVIDLIEAESPQAAHNAASQLKGAIDDRLEPIYNNLIDIMAHFHAIIDYTDEDIDEFKIQDYILSLKNAEAELAKMLSTHERGKVLRDGIPTAIIGRPNTGKSSLLNALLGYERAIVTEIPGTTRDTIEEKVIVGGVLLRIIDTAGLRSSSDEIEKLGIERTRDAVNRADVTLLVLDGSKPLQTDDIAALRSVPEESAMLIVVNKSDLPLALDLNNSEISKLDFVRISAKTGDGLDLIAEKINEKFGKMVSSSNGELITNARQAEAISRAMAGISRSINSISDSVTPDAVLTDVEAALSAVGEITGRTMREDMISRIFERFCVGK